MDDRMFQEFQKIEHRQTSSEVRQEAIANAISDLRAEVAVIKESLSQVCSRPARHQWTPKEVTALAGLILGSGALGTGILEGIKIVFGA